MLFFLHEQGYSVVGTPGWAPDAPAPFCGSTAGSPNPILFPPMLFARIAPAPGPQHYLFAEKAIAKVGKEIHFIDSFLEPVLPF
jgi:hypothetical protein